MLWSYTSQLCTALKSCGLRLRRLTMRLFASWEMAVLLRCARAVALFAINQLTSGSSYGSSRRVCLESRRRACLISAWSAVSSRTSCDVLLPEASGLYRLRIWVTIRPSVSVATRTPMLPRAVNGYSCRCSAAPR